MLFHGEEVVGVVLGVLGGPVSIAEEAIDDFTFDKLDIENMDSDSGALEKAGAQA